MKKNLALLLFVLVTTFSYAQSDFQDVVYLKNGGIIRGVIIEQIINKSIKIETVDRNVFVYQIDEVERITREPYLDKSRSSLNNTGIQSGYKGILEFGYEIGTGVYGMDRLKLNIINGYQINPYFYLGVGTGLRYYFDAKEAVIPVYADFRTYFTDKKATPYLSLGIGYSFITSGGFDGLGFLLNPTIGVSFKVSDISAMNVGLGYEMQKMEIYYFNNYGYYSSFENSGAISINVGITF